MLSRRTVITSLAAGAVSATMGRQAAPVTSPSQPVSHTALFPSPEASFEAMRALGYTPACGADIMETLQTLDHIDLNNLNTWYSAWNDLATMVNGWGAESEADKKNVSAYQAYLRSSMYYRSAGFFLTITPEDPRLLQTYDNSVGAFRKAIQYLSPKVTPITIPYEGTILDGYYCEPVGATKPYRTLILHTGFDGTAEEIYFCAKGAIDRGIACVIFDGPGQGAAIRKRGLTFIPDWERPVGAVIDWCEKHPDLDLRHLALIGFSFGGYLAPRAAAYDDRIKICIADGGVYSEFDAVMSQMPKEMEGLLESDPATFNKYFNEALGTMGLMARWALGNGLYTFGCKTPAEWCQKLRAYTLKDAAPKIKATTLVIDSEGDTMIANQAKPLYDALTCPKTYMVFTAKEGAQLHCQVGALNQMSRRVYDWLLDAYAKLESASSQPAQ